MKQQILFKLLQPGGMIEGLLVSNSPASLEIFWIRPDINMTYRMHAFPKTAQQLAP